MSVPCVVKLHEKVFKNCTRRKKVPLFVTIVTFSGHPFDKYRRKWYCDVGILCKEFIIVLIRRENYV